MRLTHFFGYKFGQKRQIVLISGGFKLQKYYVDRTVGNTWPGAVWQFGPLSQEPH